MIIPEMNITTALIFGKSTCLLHRAVADRQKPRASVERLREASKLFEGFFIAHFSAHVNPPNESICLALRPLASALRRIARQCRAWRAVAVRVEPRRPAAWCKSWEGVSVQPRGYVNKTFDALTDAGVLRRHCERDPIPAHTGDGGGKATVTSQVTRSSRKTQTVSFGFDGLGRLADFAQDQNSVTSC